MGSLAPPLSATTESFGRHEVNGPTAGGKERGEGDGPGEGDGEGDGVQQNQGFGVGSVLAKSVCSGHLVDAPAR